MYCVNTPRLDINLIFILISIFKYWIEWKQRFVNICAGMASEMPSERKLIIVILTSIKKVKIW